MKNVVIVSITSDIGYELAKKYHEEGYKVIGTYRSRDKLEELEKIATLIYCDVSNTESIKEFTTRFKDLGLKWDLAILCPATLKPIGPFFSTNFDEWQRSVDVNALQQLRIIHSLNNSTNADSSIILFAGGGTNSATSNYSAYTISKIMLIKMCELIGFENPDLNIFIIGPGWVKTKIHDETIEAGTSAGNNLDKTKEFVNSNLGTSMDSIYCCINSLVEKGKVCSGRNFSVVHDSWDSDELYNELNKDFDMYKLRRCKNDWRKS